MNDEINSNTSEEIPPKLKISLTIFFGLIIIALSVYLFDTQGGMKSLWNMMREKNLSNAYRISLENLGQFDYHDSEAENAIRHVQICPLYAISQIK